MTHSIPQPENERNYPSPDAKAVAAFRRREERGITNYFPDGYSDSDCTLLLKCLELSLSDEATAYWIGQGRRNGLDAVLAVLEPADTLKAVAAKAKEAGR